MRSAFTRVRKMRICACKNCTWTLCRGWSHRQHRATAAKRRLSTGHPLVYRHLCKWPCDRWLRGRLTFMHTPDRRVPVTPRLRRARQVHCHRQAHPNEGLRSVSGPLGSSRFDWVAAINEPERPSLCAHGPMRHSPRRVYLPGISPQKSPDPARASPYCFLVNCLLICPRYPRFQGTNSVELVFLRINGHARDPETALGKKLWALFDAISIGDEFAIKGLGGKFDLTVHYIGEVTGIDAKKGLLRLKKLDRPLFKGKGPFERGGERVRRRGIPCDFINGD